MSCDICPSVSGIKAFFKIRLQCLHTRYTSRSFFGGLGLAGSASPGILIFTGDVTGVGELAEDEVSAEPKQKAECVLMHHLINHFSH